MVENMRDQAIPNGVIINDVYCDRSMTRDYDREALNAFFATLKENDFEVVVVRSLNEITDDIYDLEEFVKTITDMGIWLYSLEVGPMPITVFHAEGLWMLTESFGRAITENHSGPGQTSHGCEGL